MKRFIIILAVSLMCLLNTTSLLSYYKNARDFGLFMKLGMGEIFSSDKPFFDFDIAMRSKSLLIGYSYRGFIDLNSSGGIHAGTLRYVLREGPFVLIAGGGIGGLRGGYADMESTSFCAMASLDLGLYLGPVGLNFSIEPVLSKESFVLGSLSICLLR